MYSCWANRSNVSSMPRAGLLGRFEEAQAGLIGGRFLGAAVGQQRAHQQLVAAGQHADAGARGPAAAAAAGHHQADAEQLDQQALGLVTGDAVAQLGQMAAGDMARLVRDDADHLVGRFRLLQGAGMHEDVAAVEHEGIEDVVLDDAHGDACDPRPAARKIGRA